MNGPVSPTRPLRSLLFAPANRAELVEKFPRYGADAFAIDLEDGTPESDKVAARGDLPRMVALLRSRGVTGQLFVRVNEWRSPLAEADVMVAAGTAIDGIIIPKLGAVGDLQSVSAIIRRGEDRTGRALQLIGIIETAAGVVNVEAIASSGDTHLGALAFGAEDFITDMGGRRTADGLEVLYARSRVVLAARVAGLAALDQVFVNIRDDDAFRRDAAIGRQLGYDGKMCVVPRQAAIANEIFSPSAEEIERSRRLVHACAAARAEGRGAVDFEGGMVDEPLLRRAEAVVRWAAEQGIETE